MNENPAPSSPRVVSALSFEEALAELEAIVVSLEQGKASLDTAISSYERGAALKQHCEAKLREAREKVERITLDASGQATGSRPMDSGQ
jgi:exodeoxyribonuclease VII small subunit